MTGTRKLRFWKMTGSGNDFIVVDNRRRQVDTDRCRELVRMACRPKLSVGADGAIFIEEDAEVDFSWRFFNADGSEAEMCGNGARCAARFAFLNGIVATRRMAFRTLAGIIDAEVEGERVRIQTTPPSGLRLDLRVTTEDTSFLVHYVNTGVPHTVLLLRDVEALRLADVDGLGRTLRHHDHFRPAGTNVNFVHVADPHQLLVRTYERGVEAETLACGTGSIASAVVAAAKGLVRSPVDVRTESGQILTIFFTHQGGQFDQVHLEGGARVVYEADLWDETLLP